MKDFLFIVPARGGSKRLPNKNLMKIGGISLLQWTDNAVKACDKDADISLTTDNKKIAEEGQKLGWNVPFIRPKNLSQDSSRTFDAVIHLLNWRKNNGLKDPKYIVLLQVTSPFRGKGSIDSSCKIIKENVGINAVVGFVYLKHKLENYYTIKKDNLHNIYNKNIHKSNNIAKPNGAIYTIKTSILRKYKTFIPPKTYPLIMDDVCSIDIDNSLDLELANNIIKNKLIKA